MKPREASEPLLSSLAMSEVDLPAYAGLNRIGITTF